MAKQYLFDALAHSHPTGLDLQEYCRKALEKPDAIGDDEFQRFEGHLLVCETCLEVAMQFERRMKAKTFTAGSSRMSA